MPRDEKLSASDYASLRDFVPPTPREPAPEPAEDNRVSVVEWLLGIGKVVARRMHTVPGSPIARIHARR
ncbi:MAG: hypothetical protein H0T46_37790 [Deltaproteobacteria bacterium]|nr:hypothetical protein [Deltaproteobacteria bacterium]